MTNQNQSQMHWPETGLFPLAIVGTSHYKTQIQRIAQNSSSEPALVFCTAELVPENDNAHDTNAVLVSIDNIPVGHLPKEIAEIFRGRLRVNGLENQRTNCSAIISAGHEFPHQLLDYRIELDLQLADTPTDSIPEFTPLLRCNGHPEFSSIENGRYLVKSWLPPGLLDDMDKNKNINSWPSRDLTTINFYAQNRVGVGSGYWLFSISKSQYADMFGENEAIGEFVSIDGRKAEIELFVEA